ncbi:hypothetical protein [Pseudomonas costantinii]|uniref:Virulence factor Evf domain-containing protein n=1 Tax=Pseudomonas costantinii TaxID=168469 RepID=A0A1S2UQ14_9PSED|nr:hypothetical protein [Pseudomonas costantinii]OIN48474.1 hypothetical protein BFL40_25125 [Pseudomonas costantinii]SED56020.1 hypothetical protein SAMN04515675_1575 [Pseudomonas costantinii]
MKTLTAMPAHVKDVRLFSEQLKEANSFFGDPALKDVKLKDDPYADKDGLIEFIIGNELVDDPEVMKKIGELKQYLIKMTSVVTNYVQRKAEAEGEKYKTDVELWSLALSKLPLMGPSKIDEQSYSRHIRGVSIATDFVNFILDIVVSQGSSALNSFQKFMAKQGDALRFGVENNKDFYKTITVGVSIEVIKIGKTIMYIPKIKQYRVNFDRSNSKFSSACASAEFVDINFAYKYGANVFDYEALNDPIVKKDFDEFLRKQQQSQIEDASTFFGANFPVNKATPAAATKAG